MKLVKTQQGRLRRDVVCDNLQRVGLLVMIFQVVLHPLHESVKVHPLLVRERHGSEKAIHQKTFPAPHAAPEIHALRRRRGRLLKPLAPAAHRRFRRVALQLVRQPLQAANRPILRRICGEAALGKFRLKCGKDRIVCRHGKADEQKPAF